MVERVRSLGTLVDDVTQRWVKRTGRRIAFDQYPWLRGPIGQPGETAGEWLLTEARRVGGHLTEGGGLLGRLTELTGDGFYPSQVANPVVDFYERTSEWQMLARSHWYPAVQPLAWLLSSVFAQRLDQFDIPVRRHATVYEVNNRIVRVQDERGSQLGAAWLRTVASTGRTIYSGWYGVVTLPGSPCPSLRVVFPLPNGSVTVFLRPEVRSGGTLTLLSPIGPFGTDGAYLVVTESDRAHGWAKRVPLSEQFVLSPNDDGSVQADHNLTMWKIPVFHLRYQLTVP
jgi:hypothetical protein